MDSLDQAKERYHERLREFVKGDAGPMLQLISQREDVVWCNPFRPFARGPREVAEAIEQAASQYVDGVWDFEAVTAFATAELGYTVELERARATIDGSEGSLALGVTSIYRLDDDGWRIALRHAEPITPRQTLESILQK